jgi:hypothetical protein
VLPAVNQTKHCSSQSTYTMTLSSVIRSQGREIEDNVCKCVSEEALNGIKIMNRG